MSVIVNTKQDNPSVSFCVPEAEHIVTLEKLCACLNTSSAYGLTCKYAKYILKLDGENKYTKPASNCPPCSNGSFVRKLFPTKCDSEWSKRDWDRVFNARIDDEYVVVRDSRKLLIRRRSIVRGDIIHLKTGQIVPADIRIISCDDDLIVDNRIITGNAEERKTNIATSSDFLLSQNMAFACTVITRGNCEGIVLTTGDRTVFAELTQFATKVRYVKRQSSNSSLSSDSMGSSNGQLSAPSSIDLSQSNSSISLDLCRGSSMSIATATSVLSL